MFDKHYDGQRFNRYFADMTISVRLSVEDYNFLRSLYPDKSISFAVRSLLHDCMTKMEPQMYDKVSSVRM